MTSNVLFQYKAIKFGIKTLQPQRLINSSISGMDGIGAYIDDVIIYSDFGENHLGTIKQFIDRITEYRLTVY